MKIKKKLTLGIGVLFLLIMLLAGVGASYINALKADTENILVSNYNSLEYVRYMQGALEKDTPDAFVAFESNLKKQEATVTEPGEGRATADLRTYFERYQKDAKDSSAFFGIKMAMFAIMDLNMKAIHNKSEVAKMTAEAATFWIAVTGTLCCLIAFVLLINIPSNISNPIRELSESIKQIAAGKYSERVHFESHNEFGELAKSFNTMAKKLEEYNNSNLAKLMMEKQRIETLINNMHDPVIGLDETLKVIFANEEAVHIIGLQHANLVEHSAKELAEKNDLMRLLIQDLTTDEKPLINHKIQPLKIFADGKEGYFEKETLHISIVPTGEQESQLIGHVLVLRNVTAYKELDFAKTNFMATVSHEFKTPIAAIKMSLQLLGNESVGQLNEEQKSLVESISEDAGRLLKITGELLDMTQVESGNIQLSILPAIPSEIVQYAIHATKTQAEQKHVRIQQQSSGNLTPVMADQEKTAWVLTNLLSNAIRYSYEDSTICVDISESEKTIQIAVRDHGQGISPQYKDKIFERYFRVPGTQQEGTGLGLAISKEFIEAQGGYITVDSEFGTGSTFTVILNKAQ